MVTPRLSAGARAHVLPLDVVPLSAPVIIVMHLLLNRVDRIRFHVFLPSNQLARELSLDAKAKPWSLEPRTTF